MDPSSQIAARPASAANVAGEPPDAAQGDSPAPLLYAAPKQAVTEPQAPMSKTPFVIITLPRSGSYHLRALLDSAPDIRCYGEIFKGSEVELPPEELALLGLGKKDTDKRDEMGMAVLNRLRKRTDAGGQIFGFKDFRFNLARVKIFQKLLNSENWRKVFLFRNPVERYISMERADLTGVFVVTERTKDRDLDLKRPIRFDPDRFERSLGSHRNLHKDAVKALDKHGADLVHLVDYTQLNTLETRKTLLGFLGSAADGTLLASDHVKQFTAPLESGVENWDEMQAYLAKTQQMDLLPAR
ncbi:MAG: hypothetical protein E6Q73_04990 [Pseudorhodobacter sp.]|nr:MAG: hypothetical protein E6Q73_04990 [Pseudorhodobacter sp.]